MVSRAPVLHRKDEQAPPRARILAAAADLFYRHGIRAVGVDAIAEAAGTNKMTLYRHFSSKDALIAEYLRQKFDKANECWQRYERRQPATRLRSCVCGSKTWQTASPTALRAAARSRMRRSSWRRKTTRCAR